MSDENRRKKQKIDGEKFSDYTQRKTSKAFPFYLAVEMQLSLLGNEWNRLEVVESHRRRKKYGRNI